MDLMNIYNCTLGSFYGIYFISWNKRLIRTFKLKYCSQGHAYVLEQMCWTKRREGLKEHYHAVTAWMV